MNTARLGRLWTEAKGNHQLMAEQLGDELKEAAAFYVTTDRLAAAIETLRTEIASSRADIMRAVIWAQVAGTGTILIGLAVTAIGLWLK